MKENPSVPAVTEKSDLAFVEIPYSASSEQKPFADSRMPAVIIRTASLQIEISNDVSDVLLERILREVSHA